jgi:hypothetical protein
VTNRTTKRNQSKKGPPFGMIQFNYLLFAPNLSITVPDQAKGEINP